MNSPRTWQRSTHSIRTPTLVGQSSDSMELLTEDMNCLASFLSHSRSHRSIPKADLPTYLSSCARRTKPKQQTPSQLTLPHLIACDPPPQIQLSNPPRHLLSSLITTFTPHLFPMKASTPLLPLTFAYPRPPVKFTYSKPPPPHNPPARSNPPFSHVAHPAFSSPPKKSTSKKKRKEKKKSGTRTKKSRAIPGSDPILHYRIASDNARGVFQAPGRRA